MTKPAPSDTPLTDEVIRQGGTLFINLSEHARSLERSLAAAQAALQKIQNYCDAPHWTSSRRWIIRDIAKAALAPQEGQR